MHIKRLDPLPQALGGLQLLAARADKGPRPLSEQLAPKALFEHRWKRLWRASTLPTPGHCSTYDGPESLNVQPDVDAEPDIGREASMAQPRRSLHPFCVFLFAVNSTSRFKLSCSKMISSSGLPLLHESRFARHNVGVMGSSGGICPCRSDHAGYPESRDLQLRNTPVAHFASNSIK